MSTLLKMKHQTKLHSLNGVFIYLLIFLSVVANGQKKSWTTYFPSRTKLVGWYTTGGSPMDMKIAEPNNVATFTTDKSSTTLDMDQKRSFAFGLNELFKSNKLRVVNVEATGVVMDLIDKQSLYEIAPGANFVYAGLRAESSKITFRRGKNQTFKSDEIISLIKTVYPAIEATAVGKLLDFLKISASLQDSSDIVIEIKDPEVYFLMQVAKVEVEWNTATVDWNRKCASFPTRNGTLAPIIKLENKVGSLDYKTGKAKAYFAAFDKGAQAEVWFEISKQSDSLFLYYTSNYTQKPKLVRLEERNGTWSMDKQFVFRYPYDTHNSRLKFKDVLVTFDAKKVGNTFEITSGATNQVCGSSYLNYPQSKLIWITF